MLTHAKLLESPSGRFTRVKMPHNYACKNDLAIASELQVEIGSKRRKR
jgi:hypothetical protein